MKNPVVISKVVFKKDAALFQVYLDGMVAFENVKLEACVRDSWLFARRLGQKAWRRVVALEPGQLQVRAFTSAMEAVRFEEMAQLVVLQNAQALRSVARVFDTPDSPEAQEATFVARAVQELEDLGRVNRRYGVDPDRRGDYAGDTHVNGLIDDFDAEVDNPRAHEVTREEFEAMRHIGKSSAWFGDHRAAYWQPLTKEGAAIVQTRLLELAREYVRAFKKQQLALTEFAA